MTDLAVEAWDEIDVTTIRKSWKKIIAKLTPTDLDADSSQDANSDEAEATVSEFTDMLDTIGCQMDGEEVSVLLQNDNIDPGFHTYTDDEICELVMQAESAEHKQEEKEDEV